MVLHWYLINERDVELQNELPRTEQLDPSSRGIDARANADALDALWDGQVRAVASVEAAIPQLSKAAASIVERLGNTEGRLIYAGAGSSGLLAMQDGMEMTQTFSWPASRLIFLMAGGDKARLTQIGVEEDNADAATRDLEKINLTKDDVVIAVAASGTTPYTVSMLKQANRVGALTVGIANNENTDVLNLASCPVFLDSGPEVIAGSTRLGAGTAQKAALGMLSTLVMMRLGHVVDGWMVSVVADNFKLRGRACRIVSDISGCVYEDAKRALEKTSGDVKPAILVALGASAEKSNELLSQSNGQLRAAMKNLNLT